MGLSLTVGIPTWNRAPLLRRTLEALTQLRRPADLAWEVLVCDNASTDATKATIESFSGRLPLKNLFEPRPGKSFALNRIAGEATGAWVLFLDDDVRVDSGWLEAYVAGMRAYPAAGLLGGPITPWLEHPRAPRTGRSAYLLRRFPWVYGCLPVEADRPIQPRGGDMPHGANLAVRRDLLGAEPFDPAKGMIAGKRVSGEDTDWVLRLLHAGAKGWLLAGAAVGHYIPSADAGLAQFCRWHRGIGHRWVAEKGPAPPGKLGLRLGVRRIVLRRLMQAAWRWRPNDPVRCYECLGDAMIHLGYLDASRTE